jgi:hypothetical protein
VGVQAVRTTLDELIIRWRGRRADFEVVMPDDERHLWAYQGILDGPYLGDDAGVGFVLGSRVIEGNIAVEGPVIHFLSADLDAKTAPILGENYVELRVVELPLVADVQGHEATWEASLVDQRTARCRLVAADPDGRGRE